MLLFIVDIDGTLVRVQEASGRALRQVLEEWYHLPDPFLGIPLSGRTDRNIVEAICRRYGLPLPDWPPFIARMAEHLARELARTPGSLCPAADAFAAQAHRHPDVRLALGTGNFRTCAYLKLAAHRLDGYFPVGGFGEDGPDRAAVLRQAWRAAAAYYGLTAADPVVIGDTPLDVEAAHAAGFPCIGVATGHFRPAELQAASPDALIEDLSQVWEALKAIPLRSSSRF
ncbi:MAG: haloacid dehalogenase-like hydrolase [Firmicutes bacterium]|nr:HAD hydrolase-like protein [Alicyclobacillaceae bacterium]MCL6496564.1 haloacid dehalogenase-like hydrolase [Bacillota bacterium]